MIIKYATVDKYNYFCLFDFHKDKLLAHVLVVVKILIFQTNEHLKEWKQLIINRTIEQANSK
jgi:hypothetical protein